MKKKNKFRPDRLRKLALYLLSDKANKVNYEITEEPEYIDHGEYFEQKLSFYMQAISESMFVFKNEWDLSSQGQAVWKEDKHQTIFTSAMEFYGLTSIQFQHLFIPGYQQPLFFGGKVLGYIVAPKEIENIIEMLTRLSAQLN
ncbi:MAG: hypothetical protein IPI10_17470 [Bacteroidetes bacterium]|nr:hypothetical protein [Bacteroidota bacterium]